MKHYQASLVQRDLREIRNGGHTKPIVYLTSAPFPRNPTRRTLLWFNLEVLTDPVLTGYRDFHLAGPIYSAVDLSCFSILQASIHH
jgi:hypothetical protein